METILQIVGALSVLAAYVAGQLGLLHQEHPTYLVLNTTGAAVLAALALHEKQWDFLLLEGVDAGLASRCDPAVDPTPARHVKWLSRAAGLVWPLTPS